jgi:23S rRNA-intervening sequence protein
LPSDSCVRRLRWENYRAACRAQSHAEFATKLSDAVEEADETVYWLELLRESSLLKPERPAEILKEANELVAITVASSKTAKGGDLKQAKPPSLSIVNRQSAIVNSSDSREHP